MRSPPLAVLGGVVAQAVLGGITVLIGLNPAIVAAHFLVSMAPGRRVVLPLVRPPRGAGPPRAARRPPGDPARLGHRRRWRRSCSSSARWSPAPARTPATPTSRTGSASTRAPSPGCTPTSSCSSSGWSSPPGSRPGSPRSTTSAARRGPGWSCWPSSLAQGLIGYVQYFTGLPEALVVAHMLGASLLVVALTNGILALRRRDAATRRAGRRDRLTRAQSSSRPAARARATASPRGGRAELGEDVRHVHAGRLGADEQRPGRSRRSSGPRRRSPSTSASRAVRSSRAPCGACRGASRSSAASRGAAPSRAAVSRAAASDVGGPGSPAASSTSASLVRARATS